jgi:acyl-CoA hydrolase
MTVYVQGVSGESLPFYKALQDNPHAAAEVCFVGVHFPGINRSDYVGLHARARQRAYFMAPGLRAALSSGRAQLLPLDYPGIFADLAERVAVDVAIAQVTPPDDAGLCSLGPCVDFLPAVWHKARLRIGHINPLLPRTRSSFSVAASDFDAVFEQEARIVSCESSEASESLQRRATLIASLVRDGDTIQCGVGKLPSALLGALTAHRKLRLYSGLAPSACTKLIDSGAIFGKASIQAGVALGDEEFYRRLAADDSFFFRPVTESHDVCRISAIQNFCAINSAIEVDLFGQVNADSVNGRLVAGVGGLPTFASGARLSPGGRSIISLPATTEDGSRSRIVPTLCAGASVTIPRHGADYVVTEYGSAALRDLSLHARARALIEIAAPQFREELERAWCELAGRF